LFETNRTTKGGSRPCVPPQSVLYHAFNLKGITYRATRFKGDVTEYFADVKEEYIRCPKCGWQQFTFKGQKTRRFHLGLTSHCHSSRGYEGGILTEHQSIYPFRNFCRIFALQLCSSVSNCYNFSTPSPYPSHHIIAPIIRVSVALNPY